jgi:hypothetical protein
MCVAFRLIEERSEKAPAPKKLKVAWPEFQEAVLRLLETLHPGTRAAITSPKPDGGGIGPRYEWSYTFDYLLKPQG